MNEISNRNFLIWIGANILSAVFLTLKDIKPDLWFLLGMFISGIMIMIWNYFEIKNANKEE